MYKPLDASDEKQRKQFFLDVVKFSTPLMCSETSPELPFFHTTRGKSLRGIYTDLQIGLTECEVFNEKLLYLFYGKPAYRLSGDERPTSDPGPFPVTFILKPISDFPLKRLFPFDTGALANNIFKDFCEDSVNPAKYELDPTSIQIQKFISFFYGSASNYFDRKCQLNEDDIQGFHEEIRHIFALIKTKSRTISDNRGYTLEAQIDEPLAFNGTTVEAIVMPANYCGNQDFDDYVFNEGIDVISYSIDQDNPKEMVKYISEKV